MRKKRRWFAFFVAMALMVVGLTPLPVSAAGGFAGVSYSTHVENIGWQNQVKNGATSGTEGRSLRLEGIKINLQNQDYEGGIEYQTHVQNIGWQRYVSNGMVSGTSGKSLRLEAIRIRLTGEMAQHYDVYYQVHAENVGWMGWAKNNEPAGTAGYAYRLEGIRIRLVAKGGLAPGSTANAYRNSKVSYSTHVENVGWQGTVSDGVMSGTSGRSLRLEGIRISLPNQEYGGNIEYRTHVQNDGWQNYVSNGATSGTSGRGLRLEAIQIRLTGEMAQHYDVYYQVHAQNFGWMGWAKNDEPAGTAGYSYRLEGIRIQLVAKGGNAPGSTANAFNENRSMDKEYVIDLGNGRTDTVFGHFEDGYSQRVFELLNEYRMQNDLDPLSPPSAALEQGSTIRAYESSYYFEHERPNGTMCYTVAPEDACGENLAYGSGYYWIGGGNITTFTPEEAMEGWKNSPGHNENMLCWWFGSVGVQCFARKVDNHYEYYYVQLFGL